MTSRLDTYKQSIPHGQLVALAGSQGMRWDDNSTLAFYRQLEEIETGLYMVEYADLKWRTIAPIKTIPNWVDSWTYRYGDVAGKAIFINDFSDDLPGVELKGFESTQAVRAIGTSYQYTFQDVRAAQGTNTPLETMKAAAARRVFEELMEQTVCLGNAQTGLYGINNVPGVPTALTTGGSTWQQTITANSSNPSVAAGIIANSILSGINAVLVNSNQRHTVNTVLMPLSQYALLNTTPRAPGYTDDTILSYIQGLYPQCTFDIWLPLKGAGASGADRVIFMEKNPEVFRVVMGQDFEVLAPAIKNMAAVFPCHGRTGGGQSMRPLGIVYLDGV